MHCWSPSLAPLFVGSPSFWCWCSCKGVNSSLIRLPPYSHLGLVVLRSGGEPRLLLPDRSLIFTRSSLQDQSLPCCLQWSFHPPALRLSNFRGVAIMFPLRCITGVCLLGLIQSASTLLRLLARHYVMGGMALSPTIWSHRMSVLPRHCVLTTIMGGSSVQLPLPPKMSTTTIPTMAILRIMGGTRPLKRLPQCMGGILLLFGMFLHLCTEVRQPFPRVMGGIPVWLHWLPQASALQARQFTLLCHRVITIPLLAQTSRHLIPALVKAYLLLSCTIPGPPKSFHLLPHPVLLLPFLYYEVPQA